MATETLTCIECGEFFEEDQDIAALWNEGQPGQTTGWCPRCDPDGALRPATESLGTMGGE